MAITQKRLQQIIQEEVAFYLREQEEEGGDSADSDIAKAADELGQRTLDLRIAAKLAGARAEAAEAEAQIYGDAVSEADAQNFEALSARYGDAAAAAEETARTSSAAALDAENKANHNDGLMSTISQALSTAEGGVEAAEDTAGEGEGEEPEAVTEGAIMERWNKLAFGRQVL